MPRELGPQTQSRPENVVKMPLMVGVNDDDYLAGKVIVGRARFAIATIDLDGPCENDRTRVVRGSNRINCRAR
jgi:hypothetical protein